MASRTVELVGADRLLRLLASGGSDVVPDLARGLYEEAQLIFERSQELVPFDEGVLSASGQLHAPSVSGNEIVVEITYGGNASEYAAYQHETEGLRHDPGRSDHYLQIPFEEAMDGFERRLVDRVEAIVRGLI